MMKFGKGKIRPALDDHKDADDAESATVMEDLVVEAIEENKKDVVWSMLSNALFLTGGIFHLIVAVWKYQGTPVKYFDQSPSPGYNFFMLMSFLAPLIYFANGIVDMCWALKTSRQVKHQQEEMYLSSVLKLISAKEDSIPGLGKEKAQEPISKVKRKPQAYNAEAEELVQRLTRHVGHRREINASVTFAVAAFFGMCHVIAAFNGIPIARELDFVSVHLYLLSAVFALCGRRYSRATSWASWANAWDDADRLEDLGDMLFWGGSLLDTILCDTTFNDDVLWRPVAAAVLWLVDSLLYMRGDFVVYHIVAQEMSPILGAKSPKIAQIPSEIESVLSGDAMRV